MRDVMKSQLRGQHNECRCCCVVNDSVDIDRTPHVAVQSGQVIHVLYGQSYPSTDSAFGPALTLSLHWIDMATSLASDFAYCDRSCHSGVCLSVCLSRSCIVLKRQKILTRFLLSMTVSCLSQIALKFGLHRSISSFPNFAPKWPNPVDLSVGDIRSQIAAEWLEIAQRSQWRAYRKPPSLFRMVPSLTPYDFSPSFPKWRSQTHPTSYVAFLQITLALVV